MTSFHKRSTQKPKTQRRRAETEEDDEGMSSDSDWAPETSSKGRKRPVSDSDSAQTDEPTEEEGEDTEADQEAKSDAEKKPKKKPTKKAKKKPKKKAEKKKPKTKRQKSKHPFWDAEVEAEWLHGTGADTAPPIPPPKLCRGANESGYFPQAGVKNIPKGALFFFQEKFYFIFFLILHFF